MWLWFVVQCPTHFGYLPHKMDGLLAYSDSSDDDSNDSDCSTDKRSSGKGAGGAGAGAGAAGRCDGKPDNHNKRPPTVDLPTAAEAFAAVLPRGSHMIPKPGKRRRKAGDPHDGMWPALVFIDGTSERLRPQPRQYPVCCCCCYVELAFPNS